MVPVQCIREVGNGPLAQNSVSGHRSWGRLRPSMLVSPGIDSRTSGTTSCSSAAAGGLPRPAAAWHSTQLFAMKVGPSPHSNCKERSKPISCRSDGDRARTVAVASMAARGRVADSLRVEARDGETPAVRMDESSSLPAQTVSKIPNVSMRDADPTNVIPFIHVRELTISSTKSSMRLALRGERCLGTRRPTGAQPDSMRRLTLD